MKIIIHIYNNFIVIFHTCTCTLLIAMVTYIRMNLIFSQLKCENKRNKTYYFISLYRHNQTTMC